MQRNITRVLIPLDQGLSRQGPACASPCLRIRPRRSLIPQRSFHPLALVSLDNTMRGMDRQFQELEREVNGMWRELAPGFYELDTDRHSGLRARTRARAAGTGEPQKEEGEKIVSDQNQNVQEADNKYTLNLFMGQDISPENIKVSVKNGVMTVEAKIEQKSQDGNSSFYQEISRQFTLPPNLDSKGVKSVLTPDGILRIEAPLPKQALPEPPKPTAIPIEIVE